MRWCDTVGCVCAWVCVVQIATFTRRLGVLEDQLELTRRSMCQEANLLNGMRVTCIDNFSGASTVLVVELDSQEELRAWMRDVRHNIETLASLPPVLE